ncbi:hypothetical protein JCM11491_004764 [Sporobolomyces phaffii]
MARTTASDRTQEFRQLVAERERQHPPRRGAPSSPTPPPRSSDAWTVQANQVATNLRSFNNFLSTIRRAYLDLGGSHAHHSAARDAAPAAAPTGGLLEHWHGVKHLSDKERDEIDFSVKVALRKSVDRVRQLEQLEQVRISNEKRANANAPTASGLSKFLHLAPRTSSVSPQETTSQALASHRAYVTLYLNQLLQAVSERQRLQQQTRVERQLEKSASLGGFGGGDAVGMHAFGERLAEQAQRDYNAKRNSGGGPSAGGGGGEVPSIYRPQPPPGSVGFGFGDGDGVGYDEEEEDGLDQLGRELTQEQIQQFEAEESLLLRATQSDLEALKTAESSLLEISSLQSQLAVHLSQQSELTDQLWSEAVEVSGRVQDGNQQLRKAKERGKDSRMWLLVFLFGSSFTLLFLDYYTS